MKIIDLLNKIANGEQPKKIAYRDQAYEWGYDTYTSLPETSPEVQMSASLFSHYRIEYCLNDEVEIIEEKKIPEKLDVINWDKCIHGVTHKEKELAIEINKTQELLNQVIDYLKSIGE